MSSSGRWKTKEELVDRGSMVGAATEVAMVDLEEVADQKEEPQQVHSTA